MSIKLIFLDISCIFFTSDAKAPFPDLNLSISNDIIFIKPYATWFDLDFDIVKFPF